MSKLPVRRFPRSAVGILFVCIIAFAIHRIFSNKPIIHQFIGWGRATPMSTELSMEILVDAREFMSRLEQDLEQAKDRVCIQTMSFEGDAAGNRLAEALKSSPAQDRKLLVDSYSRFIVDDKFKLFPGYWRNTSVREELERTEKLRSDLQASGIQVKMTNPMDPFLIRFLARNHKKMALIDDKISYLGGINFCDHNFAWHDMTIRIESEKVAAFLNDDFSATWDGTNLLKEHDFGGLWLALLDGRHNNQSFAPVIRAIGEARSSIFIESAYLSFPFPEGLRNARKRGVRVVLLTPECNNKPVVKHYLLWEAVRAGFEVRLYPGRMNHLKAILIDDSLLITGSSNFDFISYSLQQETIAVITDDRVIAQFRDRILEPDLQHSRLFTGQLSNIGGWPRFAVMKTAGVLVVTLNRLYDRIVAPPPPEWANAE